MGCSEVRDVEIPECKEKNPDDCHRTFHVFLPSLICGDGDSDSDGDGGRLRALRNTSSANVLAEGGSDSQPDPSAIAEAVGTLPLVFAIHCFGCNSASIDTFVEHADDSDVVLVIPEGLKSSFNALHCCGYALENDVDDVGFLEYIKTSLTDEYSFIDPEYSYAVGWSNGGESCPRIRSDFYSYVCSLMPCCGRVHGHACCTPFSSNQSNLWVHFRNRSSSEKGWDVLRRWHLR